MQQYVHETILGLKNGQITWTAIWPWKGYQELFLEVKLEVQNIDQKLAQFAEILSINRKIRQSVYGAYPMPIPMPINRFFLPD